MHTSIVHRELPDQRGARRGRRASFGVPRLPGILSLHALAYGVTTTYHLITSHTPRHTHTHTHTFLGPTRRRGVRPLCTCFLPQSSSQPPSLERDSVDVVVVVVAARAPPPGQRASQPFSQGFLSVGRRGGWATQYVCTQRSAAHVSIRRSSTRGSSGRSTRPFHGRIGDFYHYVRTYVRAETRRFFFFFLSSCLFTSMYDARARQQDKGTYQPSMHRTYMSTYHTYE